MTQAQLAILQNQLFNIEQRKEENIAQYAGRFQNLLNDLANAGMRMDLQQPLLVNTFMKGVNLPLMDKKMVQSTMPVILEDAIAKCMNQEGITNANRSTPSQPPLPPPGGRAPLPLSACCDFESSKRQGR